MSAQISANPCPLYIPCTAFGKCIHDNYQDCDLYQACRIEKIICKWMRKKRYKSLKSTAKRGMTERQNYSHQARLVKVFDKFKYMHPHFFETQKGRAAEKTIRQQIKEEVITTIELYRILRDYTRY